MARDATSPPIRKVLARLIHSVFKRCCLDSSLDMAAQVSFYFALSIFPFLLVLAALAGWVPTIAGWEAFARWLADYLPARSQHMILTFMLSLSRGYQGFLSFGLLLTLWSASTGFLSLMDALTRAHGVKDERGYIKRRLIAMVATILTAVFVLLCFGIWNAGHALAAFISTDFSYAVLFEHQWMILRAIATFVVLWLAIDLVNHFLPGQHRAWRWVTPGTFFSVVSLFATSTLLNLYVTHASRMSSVYGALSGFIVMMLWIYLASLSLLIGAETDAAIKELRSNRLKPQRAGA
jgi:membrane protein